MRKNVATHKYKDPSELTQYEKNIFELRQKGMKWKEIAEKLGNSSERSIAVRYKIIQEKLAAQ